MSIKGKKAVLAFTDGYQIRMEKYVSMADASLQLKKEFLQEKNQADNIDEDISFCSEYDATLCGNGDFYYVWKIIAI